MSRQAETARIGNADAITLRLQTQKPGEQPADMPAPWWPEITRITITLGGVTLDSDIESNRVIDWSQGGTTGELILRPGLASVTVTPGRHEPRMVVYTNPDPEGLGVWHDLPRIAVTA